MSAGSLPGLADLLIARWTEPSRAGSLIITIFGDAIAPRGGEIALADVIHLLAGLAIGPGVVRTAISRLTADGWLEGNKHGRVSFYRLTERAAPSSPPPNPASTARSSAPGTASSASPFPRKAPTAPSSKPPASPSSPPACSPPRPGARPLHLLATGEPAALRASPPAPGPSTSSAPSTPITSTASPRSLPAPPGCRPNEAMPVRTLLIHDYRRVVLRDPRLPPASCPPMARPRRP